MAVTVMTNFGFMTTMEKAGIEVMQTQVGDRYVIDQLLERDWPLGGEQSGHIVWTDFTPTGDGIAASLLTLRALGDAASRTSSRSSACRSASRTSGSQTARRSRARPSSGMRSRRRTPSSRGVAACSSARRAPSPSSA